MSTSTTRPNAVHLPPESGPIMDDEQAGYEMRNLNQPVTRSERIFQEFTNGQYECAICSDEISAQAKCWDCLTCYHVYHFYCIVTWSKQYASKLCWPCPTCKRSIPQEQLSNASCWCGKQRHSALELIGNTCGSMCSRLNRCAARSCVTACQKPCHPGPCDLVECLSFCQSKLPVVIKPKINPRDEVGDTERVGRSGGGLWFPSAYRQDSSAQQPANQATYINNGSGRASPSELNDGVTGFYIFGMIVPALFLALMNWFLINWAVNRSKWWTRPLSYMHFTENMLGNDNRGALAAFVLNILIGSLFFRCLFESLKTLHTIRLELDRHGHPFRRLLVSGVLLILAAGLSFGFNVVLTLLPGQMWFDQFRHSCEGFDTRASLDIGECYARSGCFYTPQTKFALATPGGSSGFHHIASVGTRNIDKFDIIKSTDHSLEINAPFYQYYRVRGILAPSPNTIDVSGLISVDFDLANYAWRLYDMASSSNFTQARPTTPSPNLSSPLNIFTPNLIKEGTWTSTNRSQPHATFTNISLSIPNLYFYTHDCHYQAFMKVYSTTNQTDLEIHQQTRADWSPSNEDNVVMRTANFGHGPHGLEICARRGDYEVGSPKGASGIKKMRQGMGEDVIVPLGLLAVLRRDMFEMGKMGDQCSFANR